MAHTLTADQRKDLATLLERFIPRGSMEWLAQQTLGVKGAQKAIGEKVTDNKALATRIVDAIDAAGLVQDAVMRLRQGLKSNGRMTLLLADVLAGRPLDSKSTLQQFVDEKEPFLQPTVINRVMRAVCAVALGGERNALAGTGFLIGPEYVLTNFHVLEPFIERNVNGTFTQKAEGKDIYCFFDYLLAPAPPVPPNGPHPSVMVRGAKNWLVHARDLLPYDGTDKCPEPLNNEHDYVVIQLEKQIGNLPSMQGGGSARGWLTLPEAVGVEKKRVMVFQHPEKEPILLDVGDFVQPDKSGTRVWYSVSTAKGSSGGAAVDSTGGLFALHNAEVDRAELPRVNQGIKIDIIAKDLKLNAPDCIAQGSPEETPLKLWSLSGLSNPEPIIGRTQFREYVNEMVRPKGARVLLVAGKRGSGVRYSISLLKSIVGASQSVVDFGPTDLASRRMTPAAFVKIIADQLSLVGTDADRIPAAQPTEHINRWVRTDLAVWLSRQLAATEAVEPSRFPSWIVINTVQPRGGRLTWADNLKECIAALAGVPADGERTVDLPQLRWLFLGTVVDGMPVTGVQRLHDNLDEQTDYPSEFEQCIQLAWWALDRNAPPFPSGYNRRIATETLKTKDKKKPPRKVLADLVTSLITGGGSDQ